MFDLARVTRKCPGLVQHIKAGKVDVATIHGRWPGFRQEH